MTYLGPLAGPPSLKFDNGTLYLSLNAATFIPGREERKRQLLSKGKRPVKGGRVERGGNRGVIWGGRRGKGLELGTETEVKGEVGVGAEKPP